MGNLLSSLSGQFAKPIVLGTLIPVVIVSGLNLIINASLFPFGDELQNQVKRVALGETAWPIAAMTFFLLFATGLLYNLNTPIIRLYEGYPWQRSWIGQLRANRWRRRWDRIKANREALRDLEVRLRKLNPQHSGLASMKSARTPLGVLMNTDLPDKRHLVLPTRLGNVIRAFERYPYVAYGIDGILVWPLLIAKIEAGFAATIDEAKTGFDFMLNCSLLTAVTGCIVTAIWLARPEALVAGASLWYAWRAALFFGLAILFYEAAIGAAGRWGIQVRAAFDLYRVELLKLLGYQAPVSRHEEHELWEHINTGLQFPDLTPDVVAIRDRSTRLAASPPNVKLSALRKLEARAAGTVAVTIRVANKDTLGRRADNVRIIETVPDGFKCLFETVQATAGNVRLNVAVVETKPFEIDLGKIAAGTTVIVTYALRQAS